MAWQGIQEEDTWAGANFQVLIVSSHPEACSGRNGFRNSFPKSPGSKSHLLLDPQRRAQGARLAERVVWLLIVVTLQGRKSRGSRQGISHTRPSKDTV